MAGGRRRRAGDCRRADAGADDGDAACRPTRLIDINRIAALSYIREQGDGVDIGATTRQCVAERDRLVAAKVPLLARAIPNIGHIATRARGTVGGSLANADPAAELPLVAVTLDAVLGYRAGGETGEIAAGEFFIGPMITDFAGRRVSHRCALSGVERQESASAFMRSTRGAATSPSFRRRRRSSSAPTANANASPSASARRPISPCGLASAERN